MNKIKLLYIVNDPHPLKYFLFNHIIFLNSTNEFEITVMLNNDQFVDFSSYNISLINLPIKRSPNIIYDLYVTIILTFHFLNNSYNIVHSISPKSGLLSAVSSFFGLQPCRLHTFTGQVWANYTGKKRLFFKTLDRMIVKLNSTVLVDSFSQMDYLIKNRIGNKTNFHVIGKGSICGVNFNKFKIPNVSVSELRSKYQINKDAFVVLFVGRLNYDKGVLDLVKAILKLNIENIHVFFVGKDEELLIKHINQYVPENLINNFHFIDETSNPENFMFMSDLLCLPSYREGFGNVVIEAAAMGLPAVVSDIYGLADSFINEKTGISFKVKDIDDLASKILLLYNNPFLLKQMSVACNNYVNDYFDSKYVSSELYNFYKKMIAK